MDLASFLFFFLIIIPSAVIHEYFHGYVAYLLGDPTAKYAGRLTLKPWAHIDPWGTIVLPVFMFLISQGRFIFAYAKPVPINPLFFRFRNAEALVALAGPFANFLTAGLLGFLVRFLPNSTFSMILSLIVYANILLGVFNLLPFPPLDGSKILFALLPKSWFAFRLFLEQYGLLFLLIFFLFGFPWLGQIIFWLFQFFTGHYFSF